MHLQLEVIKKYTVILISVWTLLVAGSFVWLYCQQTTSMLEIAKAEARIAFQKDTLYRKWASKHGGVYVPTSPESLPNPYLAHIPERDITTPSGKALTLINPAYMTRQVFELAARENNFVKGHITSLNPIRHENAPDAWEQSALTSFESGSKEASSIELIDGQQFMRLMRPFTVEQPCLKCHAAQGYKLGDIRGGISVSVPMFIYAAYSQRLLAGAGVAHGLIWLLGLGMVVSGSRKLSRSSVDLFEKNLQLEEEAAEREMAQERLQEQTYHLEEEIEERQKAQDQLDAKARLLEEEIAVRRQAEETLMESNAFNEQIVNSANEGIIVYDMNLRYAVWNPFMENLTGMAAAEVIGRYPLDLFPFLKDGGVIERLERARAGEKVDAAVFPFTVFNSGKSGSASDMSSALLNKDGNIAGVIGIVRDITEQRKLEEQLLHSQKMEAVGQLAGGVAHDFNNILTVIGGYSHLLQMEFDEGGPARDMIDQVAAASERAANLTRSLLAFSHKSEMQFSQVNLNEIVEGVGKFLRRIIGEDISFTMTLNNDPLRVSVDRGQIEQILMNLATNARDAMQSGGSLAIETSLQNLDTFFVTAHGFGTEGDYAVMTITDTGCGMDDETKKRIFDPFFTTKGVGRGTGLGMSIVYGIVTQHDGFITVYSELGVGTAFRIYLPIYREESGGHTDRHPITAPASGTETILVVEDDENVRKLVHSVLTTLGYTVVLAEDGEAGVAVFHEHCHEISLVLMDVIMPKKSGRQACDEIRRLHPGVKVIYTSGYTADHFTHEEFDGITEFVMKPIKPRELALKIREMLDA